MDTVAESMTDFVERNTLDLSEAQTETALGMLAGLNGDARSASEILFERHDLRITPVQLNGLRIRHRELYTRISERMVRAAEEALVRDTREIAGQAAALQRRLLNEINDDIDAGRLKDPARAAASVAKVHQASVDKLLALTGRPSTVVEHRSAEQLYRALEARGVLVSIGPAADVEGTAEEIGE